MCRGRIGLQRARYAKQEPQKHADEEACTAKQQSGREVCGIARGMAEITYDAEAKDDCDH